MLFGTPSLLSFQFFVIVFLYLFLSFFLYSYIDQQEEFKVKDRTDLIGTGSSMVDVKSIYGTGSSSAHAYYVTKWRTSINIC